MYKKLRAILLISLVLITTAYVLGAPTAFAQTGGEPKFQDSGLDIITDACAGSGVSGFVGIPNDIALCANYIAAQIGYSIVWLASWLLWAVAKLFNLVLVVQNGAFHNQPMVNVGWIIARDVANIFYIFFLLIISIATIIRYESYGMKQLLSKIIISALLVNFSLPLAGLIIDFSNTLGNTFYINMSTSPDQEVGDFVKDRNGNPVKTLDISTTLISGFQPEKLLARDKINPPKTEDTEALLLNIILAEILAIILIVVVSVVLLAAMAMLITRIVVLWFVLILSPFAFLFWVLPRTSSLSGQWFETLFKHAFFYPAFMFTLYISITAIQYGVISKMISADANGLAGTMFAASEFAGAGASYFTAKIQLILNFVILTMFMAGGLLVAQRMSIEGAGAATTASKYLSGKGKAIGNRALYEGAYRPAGWAADKVSNTAVGKALARIPIARQALRAPAVAIQKRNEERAKLTDQQASRVKNLAPQAAAGMLSTLNARGQAKAFDTMNEKQRAQTIQQMNSVQQVKFAKDIHKTDPEKDYERQVAIASGSVEQAMKILHGAERPDATASATEKKEYQDKVDKYVKGLSDKDQAKLREETVSKDEYYRRSVIKNKVDTEKLQNSRDFVDPKAREAFESLTKEINSVTGAIKILHGVEPPAGAYDPAAPTAEQQTYQKLVNERVANLDEKQLSKLKPESIKDPYFQDVMFKSFDPSDMRRIAGNGENAAAIKEAVERKLGKSGPDLEDYLEHILPDAEYTRLYNQNPASVAGYQSISQVSQTQFINPNLLRMIKSGPARSLVIEGTPLSRRDVNTGQSVGAGTPPAAPPPAPPATP